MAVIEERKGRNGQTIYRVKIRKKGFPSESRSFERKTDAKEWARKREEALSAEANFGTAAHGRKPLKELIRRFLERELVSIRSTSHRNNVETHLSWWKSRIGDVPLNKVSPALLAECRDELLNSPHTSHQFSGQRSKSKGKSPATVICYMASLSLALTVAMKEWGWLPVNPMTNVKRPSLPLPRVRFLTDDERKALLDACAASDNSFLYPVVVIALSTGARYSEIMHLRWRDIDLKRGVARLEETKNRERRALPLTHLALEQISKLHASFDPPPPGSRFVFARADGEKPMEIRKHWYAAVEAAGIEDFRFHDLRHSAASYLAMNGATLAEIAAILGHKTLQMVKRYAHLSEQHTSTVVERMNRSIFADNDNNEPCKDADSTPTTSAQTKR